MRPRSRFLRPVSRPRNDDLRVGRRNSLHRALVGCIALFFVASGPGARAQDTDHSAHSVGPVPREILDKPVTVRTGIGVVHEKVSSSAGEAQQFYDQGLAYLHSFMWIEAIRSFHQALRSDENLGMAYLGLA